MKQTSDNEIYLLIKYIKSVLWRVGKRLSYTEDAQCLKVKQTSNFTITTFWLKDSWRSMVSWSTLFRTCQSLSEVNPHIFSFWICYHHFTGHIIYPTSINLNAWTSLLLYVPAVLCAHEYYIFSHRLSELKVHKAKTEQSTLFQYELVSHLWVTEVVQCECEVIKLKNCSILNM